MSFTRDESFKKGERIIIIHLNGRVYNYSSPFRLNSNFLTDASNSSRLLSFDYRTENESYYYRNCKNLGGKFGGVAEFIPHQTKIIYLKSTPRETFTIFKTKLSR